MSTWHPSLLILHARHECNICHGVRSASADFIRQYGWSVVLAPGDPKFGCWMGTFPLTGKIGIGVGPYSKFISKIRSRAMCNDFAHGQARSPTCVFQLDSWGHGKGQDWCVGDRIRWVLLAQEERYDLQVSIQFTLTGAFGELYHIPHGSTWACKTVWLWSPRRIAFKKDRIICSISDNKVREKLLCTADLTLKIAIDTCTVAEASADQIKALHPLVGATAAVAADMHAVRSKRFCH